MSRLWTRIAALATVWPALAAVAGAQPAEAPSLRTRWAAGVASDRVLPEHPRPGLMRGRWTNLNGPWDFAITSRDATPPAAFAGRILVPFPIESQLSGVRQTISDAQRAWYHRTFAAPRLAPGERLLLHFGAVDWEAEVRVNGRAVGMHRGGYDPFTFDITADLRARGEQDLLVGVWDPTDRGPQPRGKQVLDPKGIWYTAVTGIWQTVWIEVVPAAYVTDLAMTPDVDAGTLTVRVTATGAAPGARVDISALDGRAVAARASGPWGQPIVLHFRRPTLWSPARPFLYTLRVRLESGDSVESYAGLRKIAVQRDAAGVNRLFLNNQPLFQYGLLDQGWWPDGLYTAPTDAALASDIETTKRLGFNLIRKHVKVEPARWYYHCDRLGVLVWQDMPSGGRSTPGAKNMFASELAHVVDALRNHPSIVMWVPFNEGWGQHDTEQYAAWLKAHDGTRLVNNASGWTDMGAGDVSDMHEYPGPAQPPLEDARAALLGEFGGLGLPLESHTWIAKGNWGYRSFTSLADLGRTYLDLLRQVRILAAEGLAAAVYTQTTDVEVEVNGVMTYDRAIVKLPPGAPAAHAALFANLPRVRHLVPSSDREPQAWRYTTNLPSGEWYSTEFADAAWQEGTGGFGAPDTPRAHVGTPWLTSDIWLRRTFDLHGSAPANPHLRIFHDEDAEVYLNGTRVASLAGYTGAYAYVPLDGAARTALHEGRNTLAVHVKQTRGGQFIDVGLVDVIERRR